MTYSKLEAWTHPKRDSKLKRPIFSNPKAIHPDLKAQLVEGVYKVKTPMIVETKLRNTNTGVMQLWCHSPVVLRDIIYECNNSMEAYIDEIQGHAIFTKTIECSKCRTAYAVTMEVGGEGDRVKIISAKVLNLNRNMKPYVDEKLDSEKDLWVQFHEERPDLYTEK